MTCTKENEFIRRDGTVDTARAIRAGREERARAFHAGLALIRRAATRWIGRAAEAARAKSVSAG